MILENELSEAEKAMFRGLGWDKLFHTSLHAPSMYQMAVEKAFIFSVKNKYSAALREAALRLYTGKYRGNAEHDSVILEAMANYIP